jgi:hypothetical protein
VQPQAIHRNRLTPTKVAIVSIDAVDLAETLEWERSIVMVVVEAEGQLESRQGDFLVRERGLCWLVRLDGSATLAWMLWRVHLRLIPSCGWVQGRIANRVHLEHRERVRDRRMVEGVQPCLEEQRWKMCGVGRDLWMLLGRVRVKGKVQTWRMDDGFWVAGHGVVVGRCVNVRGVVDGSVR